MSERYDSHMNNHLEILSSALQYIEEHLEDKIQTEDIALACFCSKSSLEKTFRYVNDMSVHEYINRRRMTRAAKMLVEQPDISILTIALQYGYGEGHSRKCGGAMRGDNPSPPRDPPAWAEFGEAAAGQLRARAFRFLPPSK